MNFLITVSLACGWSANAGNEVSLFVCFTSRLHFALAQRGLNSLADEFRPLVLPDERVDLLGHALQQGSARPFIGKVAGDVRQSL